ncbi:Endo/exonuclease/phosphatase domain-containing protein [Mycena chlorophos]|uniref:Endo/exonuclease/phosphatase domain-containing protein n=1 Tax=Mycena chlorophos TaxID=658473 RepID=A0A8H6T7U1_MYCCL|nr:Endo/exonuclease/phosphatase domain-containing protein [Mycena chlorophos]
MATRRPIELTPEQLALSEARKAKKLKLSENPPAPEPATNLILSRPWISLNSDPEPGRIKVHTWNMLAQCLVRRELFPTSDCLKAGQRLPMLHAEILAQDSDILCLQEVDNLEKLLPPLQSKYTTHYTAGPGKKHGCMILFKKDDFEKQSERLVQYDQEEIRDEGSDASRRGLSFKTRNIASIVALKNLSKSGPEGVIVGTTHAFWHPKYTYERCRQVGIFKREVGKFATEHHLEHWPCRERLEASRVVHVSIDPTVPPTTSGPVGDDEDQAVDPDRVITNARRATPSDGLLTDDELVALFALGKPFKSAYDEGLAHLRTSASDIRTFGDRVSCEPDMKGSNEPEYTSFTFFWKTVLFVVHCSLFSTEQRSRDYIFVSQPTVITGLLAPHRAEHLGRGLPLKGICGSDHVSLSAELSFSNKGQASLD